MLAHSVRTALLLLSALLLSTCDMQPAVEQPIVPSMAAASAPEAPAYLDDRSSAEALINSFYNAVNRREYARAYSYWRADTPELPPYNAFVAGYQATQIVQARYGAVAGDAGAGQARYAVPVALSVETTGGTEYFVGCYTLHLSSPGAQATPPYQPLAIESAAVQSSSAPPTAEELEQACALEGSPVPPVPPTDTIDASVYLDNMSDPVAVLSSFYNAVNRGEYLRAYGYWDAPSLMTPLPDFATRYAAIRAATLTTGEVQRETEAGQSYYFVPVAVTTHLEDGSAQTAAGCYFLYQPDPASQAPPFQPLRITAANLQPVTGGTSAPTLMAERCRVRR
jgi:hypothetical protein